MIAKTNETETLVKTDCLKGLEDISDALLSLRDRLTAAPPSEPGLLFLCLAVYDLSMIVRYHIAEGAGCDIDD